MKGEVIYQNEIPSDKFDFLSNISVRANNIVISGGTWNQNDEGITDYIALFDSELNVIWEKILENKWEGGIKSVQRPDRILVATNGSIGVIIYELDLLGRVLNEKNIPSFETDGLFNLPNSNLLLVTLTMNSNGVSQKELITLSSELEILNKTILPMNKKDRLKNTYFPEQVKFLKDGNIASLWSGRPPITSFSTPHDTTVVSVKHVRHDIYFYDIEYHQRDTYLYSGKLGKLAAVYEIEGSKILEKITFGIMGTWSTNKIFRISDTDYILVTDIIRMNDFESNIEIIRLKIK